MTNQHPAPVRIRPAIGDAIGTTAFFRNRILNETLLSELLKAGHKKYSVLFHACSIGAEVYSFIIQYLERGLDKNFALTCQALDKQQEFLDFARAAQFPPEILSGCSINEKTYFIELNKQVSPINKVQNYVEFLPANDFLSFTSETDFDVVFLLNALVYVPYNDN
jgi:chemotaxis methyl-accepting protein methylase